MDVESEAGRPGEIGLSGLLADLCDGRIEALDTIWEVFANDMYALALWRTASVADAEDAVQEVFVRLARRPRSLRRVRHPRSYLLRMVRNAAANLVAGRREKNLGDEQPELVAIDVDVDARVDGDRASAALRELPSEQRETVLMRHALGLSFREIGAVCGVPVFTAASRHRLAIRRLRTILGVR